MRKPKLTEGTIVLVDVNHEKAANLHHITDIHGFIWLVVRFERDHLYTHYNVDGKSNEVYTVKSVATGYEETISGSYFVGGEPDVQEG